MDLSAVVAIVLIDLALSGDNALLIGMAARQLPDAQRRRAIVLGGALAVALRIAAAAIVTFLLAIPYLQLAGGLVLAVIAYRLVRPAGGHGERAVRPAGTLREAVLTILVADAAMSVENVLGVGGAAHGDLPLLAFGLIVSIPIVLFGSGVIAQVLVRAPRLVWLGALALIWTSGDMILSDPAIDPHLEDHLWISATVSLAILGLIAGVRARRHRPGVA